MVSQGSIIAMIVQVILGIVIPLSLLIYYRSTLKISYRAVGVGILIFIVFSQLLEQVLHVYMLSGNQTTTEWLKNPWMAAVYGGLAASIFENAGRWLGFSFLLKKRQERKDGIAVGIGHGGIEVLLISVVMGIMGIVFATMINTGTFEQMFSSKVPPEQIALFQGLRDRITHASQSEYWLGAFERIPAIFIQIALSLIVLYGIRTRKAVYLLYVVLLHALVDFFAGLYQAKMLPLWVVECIVWICGLVAVIVIVKSKEWFAKLAPCSEKTKGDSPDEQP
ncbi:YhfC family intramembrane metalloprotease [Paenibacillus sp. SYP-B3998]|uniref:YhfC family intramembrane metalloprotease n=1 Tax=Paenibacillus sp. SYP-B3998 TaxID=2678564 RepID=A0A6G4A3D7_9BACL|nr:YhfC family intramembrane metalloprotease [Paenibacillus sp. SYP-B3998]NEW08983.1 YhfC family intramembrane metalloprotease [Paenibacillus sp. SYP-B3998]